MILGVREHAQRGQDDAGQVEQSNEGEELSVRVEPKSDEDELARLGLRLGALLGRFRIGGLESRRP